MDGAPPFADSPINPRIAARFERASARGIIPGRPFVSAIARFVSLWTDSPMCPAWALILVRLPLDVQRCKCPSGRRREARIDFAQSGQRAMLKPGGGDVNRLLRPAGCAAAAPASGDAGRAASYARWMCRETSAPAASLRPGRGEEDGDQRARRMSIQMDS